MKQKPSASLYHGWNKLVEVITVFADLCLFIPFVSLLDIFESWVNNAFPRRSTSLQTCHRLLGGNPHGCPTPTRTCHRHRREVPMDAKNPTETLSLTWLGTRQVYSRIGEFLDYTDLCWAQYMKPSVRLTLKWNQREVQFREKLLL